MMIQKNIIMWVLLIVVSVSQIACGFRLRGMVNIPPEYLPIAIAADGVYIQMTPVLTQTLQGAGLSVVEVAEAKSVLRLHGENYEKQLLTVATSGESQTHSIKYSINFNIVKRQIVDSTAPNENDITEASSKSDANRRTLKKSSKQNDEKLNQLVSVTRSFQFEKKAVLSSAAEEAIIKSEMLTDAAQQIVRRLNHLKSEAIKPANVEPNETNRSEALSEELSVEPTIKSTR